MERQRGFTPTEVAAPVAVDSNAHLKEHLHESNMPGSTRIRNSGCASLDGGPY
ncbi:hypothetical protein K7432_015957 [Basidiobolus ranarum]|uniref:Uncharacterized protein n=1 Tax=Basidiobolus ranarum TaxID=34480 RepID=A0ABR2WFG2_9FUNG